MMNVKTKKSQAKSPGPDKESNWLPIPPSGMFNLTIRIYNPTTEGLDPAHKFPPVQRVRLSCGTSIHMGRRSGDPAWLPSRWHKPILAPHVPDIDKNNEQHLVLAAGYQYSETIQSGPPSHEDRMIVQLTPQHRPKAGFFVADCNRVEFRWVNGKHSTRYRNQLTVERSFRGPGVRFTPYACRHRFRKEPFSPV